MCSATEAQTVGQYCLIIIIHTNFGVSIMQSHFVRRFPTSSKDSTSRTSQNPVNHHRAKIGLTIFDTASAVVNRIPKKKKKFSPSQFQTTARISLTTTEHSPT